MLEEFDFRYTWKYRHINQPGETRNTVAKVVRDLVENLFILPDMGQHDESKQGLSETRDTMAKVVCDFGW